MSVLFVTGTDTGVGKTVVSATLCARAAAAGQRVRYCKPIQTGIAVGARGSDADFVRAVSGVECFELLRFDEALAPAVAAARAGVHVDTPDLVMRMRALAEDVDLLIVEGAGGLLAPFGEGTTMADVARALDAALVIVARPGLGTLNHTALTIEAARSRGLAIDRVVVSGWPENPNVTERTNLEWLRAHGLIVETLADAGDVDVEGGRVGALPLTR